MPTFAGLKKLKVRNGEVCFLTSLQKSDCWASKVPKTTNRKAGVDSKGAENSDDASNGPLKAQETGIVQTEILPVPQDILGIRDRSAGFRLSVLAYNIRSVVIPSAVEGSVFCRIELIISISSGEAD
jgi:hypothetical protein